jgi:hypothetical protein
VLEAEVTVFFVALAAVLIVSSPKFRRVFHVWRTRSRRGRY